MFPILVFFFCDKCRDQYKTNDCVSVDQLGMLLWSIMFSACMYRVSWLCGLAMHVQYECQTAFLIGTNDFFQNIYQAWTRPLPCTCMHFNAPRTIAGPCAQPCNPGPWYPRTFFLHSNNKAPTHFSKTHPITSSLTQMFPMHPHTQHVIFKIKSVIMHLNTVNCSWATQAVASDQSAAILIEDHIVYTFTVFLSIHVHVYNNAHIRVTRKLLGSHPIPSYHPANTCRKNANEYVERTAAALGMRNWYVQC